VIEQTNGISGDQSTKGVSNDTQLPHSVPVPRQLFQLLLNLRRDALAAQFNAIVCEAAGVALGDENMQAVFGILLS